MTQVIQNERHYETAQMQVARLEGAIRALPTDPSSRPNVAPELQELERGTIQDVIDELHDEMAEYEALVDGTRTGLGVMTLEELPRILLAAREAANLSVGEFAGRLGVTEAQLHEYERTLFATAQFSFILLAADLLGLRVRGHIDVTFPTSAAWRADIEAQLRRTLRTEAQTPVPSDD